MMPGIQQREVNKGKASVCMRCGKFTLVDFSLLNGRKCIHNAILFCMDHFLYHSAVDALILLRVSLASRKTSSRSLCFVYWSACNAVLKHFCLNVSSAFCSHFNEKHKSDSLMPTRKIWMERKWKEILGSNAIIGFAAKWWFLWRKLTTIKPV